MTVHDCDLCNASNGFLDLPGDPSGKIKICGTCGFVVVRERRSVQEVAVAWDQIYASGGYDPNWPGVKARLFYVANWLDCHLGISGRSILDIGAGNGNFLAYCRDLGGYPVGLDPSGDNVRKVKALDIACFHGWAADNSPDIGQYDIVTLNWTLENTGDCMSVLRWAKRQLAPNGHLVVATGSRIGVPFKKPLSEYLPQDTDYPHDTHCFRWSHFSLAHAGHLAGLKPTEGAASDTALWNDAYNRDELIAVFENGTSKYVVDNVPYAGESNLVLNHFRRWQEQFP